jgi:hypothetical protein
VKAVVEKYLVLGEAADSPQIMFLLLLEDREAMMLLG